MHCGVVVNEVAGDHEVSGSNPSGGKKILVILLCAQALVGRVTGTYSRATLLKKN